MKSASESLFEATSLLVLSQYLTKELKKQDAAWIIDESVGVENKLLSLFTFSPLGFSFYFPPYSVGPYAQGPFEVQVPLTTLQALDIESKLLSFIQ